MLSVQLNPLVNPSASLTFGAAKKNEFTPVQEAFKKQNLKITQAQAKAIAPYVKNAVDLIKQFPNGNSQIDFQAIQIVAELKLDGKNDASIKDRVVTALKEVAKADATTGTGRLNEAWNQYFDQTVSLTSNSRFLELTRAKKFSPVKISWEDIGRYAGSSWGNRISDVGIWVRKDEKDPQTAKLALAVRRDQNFSDKVLVVPAENIKIHGKKGNKVTEMTLPEKLKELGLTSKSHDKNVIVSNQFAVVPVPAKEMGEVSKAGEPPRAAFTFSIQPYGSTNMVITDVIEGSSNAVVSGYKHQLLYANKKGEKAPFTASRAEDRKDLMKLEADLKAKGMDVDVQRYYLIQVPLDSKAANIQAANMGEPPFERNNWFGDNMPFAFAASAGFESAGGPMLESVRSASPKGLDKVAIGTGDAEGKYNEGSGYRGARAEEPIRVTVAYFVTPKGEVTEADMQTFTKTFESWDQQAIWGGSFVTKES
ncbi:MAG: hypothetical protein K2X66_07730 [Cyanobacteria bacterium]|nr:hypothetical protein [Cyanobacteriota bacterium]